LNFCHKKTAVTEKINSPTMLASSRTRHREGEDPQKISKEETRRGTQK
jgi:hypothetical protein